MDVFYAYMWTFVRTEFACFSNWVCDNNGAINTSAVFAYCKRTISVSCIAFKFHILARHLTKIDYINYRTHSNQKSKLVPCGHTFFTKCPSAPVQRKGNCCRKWVYSLRSIEQSRKHQIKASRPHARRPTVELQKYFNLLCIYFSVNNTNWRTEPTNCSWEVTSHWGTCSTQNASK